MPERDHNSSLIGQPDMPSLKQQLPYGTWPSPVSALDAATASLRLDAVVSTKHGVGWAEGRPAEGGRIVICGLDADGVSYDLLSAPFSARSRVHEYGGGAVMAADGRLFFINDADQDIYELLDAAPRRITNEPAMRFADMCLDVPRNRLIAVAEFDTGAHEPNNLVVSVALAGAQPGNVQPLVAGGDFYAAPRLSPDGRQLAFLTWNHPHMPWDAACLQLATLDEDGDVASTVLVAGGAKGAAFQPCWSKDGALYFVVEKGEWSGLCAWREGTVVPVLVPQGELLLPLWNFAMTSYAVMHSGRIAALLVRNGEQELVSVQGDGSDAKVLPLPCRQLLLPIGACGEDAIVAIAQYDRAPPAIVRIDMDSGAEHVLYRAGKRAVACDVSIGTSLCLEREGRSVPALYYPPTHADFAGLDGERPPLIVTAHGGPTAMADRGLKQKIQFWTSRGFAVLDVDYRGSRGYGASHRKALDGAWGIADAQDVTLAALAAADRGLADRGRLLISGGSAGGYTALMALVCESIFRAAAVSYGVADLATLLATTHKFESRYLYGLTGTTRGATEPCFSDRSPLHQAHRIKVPTIFFQGLQDKVVPPQQSRDMAAALKRNGVPVSLVEFDDEAHGFRARAAIAKALDCEYAFYCKILRLDAKVPSDPIDIQNWT